MRGLLRSYSKRFMGKWLITSVVKAVCMEEKCFILHLTGAKG